MQPAIMYSATRSPADRATDLYCTIDKNKLERQPDVYNQNLMELFEKVWAADGDSTEEGGKDGKSKVTPKRAQQGSGGPEEQVDSATDTPSDWPEIPDQGSSAILWTCDVCEARMSIFLRTEHLASEHPPKGKQTSCARKSGKKVEGEGSMLIWQCELCDEEVNIFYAAEHIVGKKHVTKLKERGEYQYAPYSEEFVEQRAVYKPQEAEEVLAREGEKEVWEAEENPGGEAYLEESAVYRPEEGEEGQYDLEPDGNPGGGGGWGEGTVYQPGEEDDWELGNNTVYQPLAGQHWGPEDPEQTQAPYAPASIQYQEHLPPSQPSYQGYSAGVTSSQPQITPAISHNLQVPIHIQVETFYCDLCDTEYPMSEWKFHSDRTFECTICDEVFHANYRATHLAGKEHMENARGNGETPRFGVPPAITPQATISGLSMPEVEVSRKGLKFRCELCNKKMAMNSRASHLAGSKHKNKEQNITALQAARMTQQKTSNSQSGYLCPPRIGKKQKHRCEICQRSVIETNWTSHLSSRKHRANEAERATNTLNTEQTTISHTLGLSLQQWGPVWETRPKDEATDAPQDKQDSGDRFYCSPCGLLMDPHNRECHLNGVKHSDAVAKVPQEAATRSSGMDNSGSSAPPAAALAQLQSRSDFHCKPCNLTLPMSSREIESHQASRKHKENELAKTTQQKSYAALFVPAILRQGVGNVGAIG